MRTIPSVDEWPREEFLKARHEQAKQPVQAPPWLKGAPVFVIEPDDDVVCDGCNAEILEPTVLLVEFGRRVACSDCYRKHYASEPVKYRVLKPDGTLGAYVKKEG